MRSTCTRLVLALVCSLLLLGLASTASAQEGSANPLIPQLRGITHELDELAEAVARNDAPAVRHAYDEVHEQWAAIEDGVRDQSPTAYTAIEDQLHALKAAVKAEPLAGAAAGQAAQGMDHAIDEFIAALGMGTVEGGAAVEGASLNAALATLDQAADAARRGDTAMAAVALREFKSAWPSVEAVVAARSHEAYEQTEDGMVKALTLLTATTPDTTAALDTIGQMQAQLQPLVSVAQYGVADAAFIMLREGLEALLIIGALLAFLKKSNNADKQRWIWLGGLGGVVVSILLAILIQRVFASALSGANRELVEGLIGLVAAGMLVYVSYWMHGKAQMGAWQQYIRQQSTSALARNSLFSLALIAFLAVLREGAETVVFYMGIAPSIELNQLVLGIGLAVAVLAVVGVAILRYGVRLPLRPFFLVTSVLLYYMAFKFVGTGIHALQVAGVVPATFSRYLPSWQFVGLFPTVETTLVQGLLVLLAVGAVLWLRRQTPVLARS